MMGSKMQPQGVLSPHDTAEDDDHGHSLSSNGGATSRLLKRIADALQVSPAALYDSPNASTLVRKANSHDATDRDLDQDCKALLDAYRCISDPEERCRVLALVQAAAEPA